MAGGKIQNSAWELEAANVMLDRCAGLETEKLFQRCPASVLRLAPSAPTTSPKLTLTLPAVGESAGRAAAPRSHLAHLPVLSGPGPIFCFLC